MTAPLLVPGGEPFLLPGGATGCLLVHGFTAMPAEMRLLGDDLAAAGHTVLGVRLAGHGTDPVDLVRTRRRDWLATAADGLAVLAGLTERVVLVGQSLGGLVVLTAAARFPAAGVVAISTPYAVPAGRRPLRPSRVVPKDGVAAHPQLGLRREADYPAYAAAPPRIGREIRELAREMRAALPTLDVPALLVSSSTDPWFPAAEHARRIAADLPGARLLVLDGPGHSIVLDPDRAEAFAAIREFVASIAGGVPQDLVTP